MTLVRQDMLKLQDNIIVLPLEIDFKILATNRSTIYLKKGALFFSKCNIIHLIYTSLIFNKEQNNGYFYIQNRSQDIKNRVKKLDN